jgi:outer membrane lipoprotein-sorting protein
MQLQSKSLEVDNDGDKTKIVFNSPRTVAGTTLLSHSHFNENDQQWIYIPKSKKIKRIAGKNKSRSFVGSQYSFEDLSSFKVNKYRYRFLREESCGELTCSVVVSYPEYKGSAYSKIISWIDSHSRVNKSEYYDRDQELLKTLTVKKYLQLDGKYWQPSVSEMINHQNGKSTQLNILNIARNSGISADDFEKSSLKKS